MPLQVDFSNVEDREFEQIPPERYECVVDSAEIRKSAAGNDYIAWQFRIVDEEKFEGKYKNRLLFHNTTLVPTALWNLKGLLENLGIDVKKGVQTIDLNAYIGKRLICNVGEREYNGQKREDVIGTYKSTKSNLNANVPPIENVAASTAAPTVESSEVKKESNDDIPF